MRGAWRVAAVLGVLAAAGPAAAQTYTWDGGSTIDSGWNRSFNWDDGAGNNVLPASGANTVIQFAGTTRLGPDQNLANPFNLNLLRFTSTAGSYFVSGDPLQFQNTSGGINPRIEQNAGIDVTVANEVRLVFGAPLTVAGTGAGAVALNGPVSGTGSLTKSGNHTLILNAANSWSGSLTVVDGTVLALASNVLTANNSARVYDGAYLNLNNRSATVSNLNLFGGSAAVGPRVATGTGTLTVATGVTYFPSTVPSEPTEVSGNLNLGATTVTVSVPASPTGAIEFHTNANITGSSAEGITKTGAGTWLARSGAWSFGGPTTLSQGGLAVGATNVLSPASTVTLASSTRLDLGYNPGTGAVYFDQRIGGLAGTATSAVVGLGNATLTVGANNDSTSYAGTITGSGGRLVKVGTGTLTLTQANTFTGGVEVQRGVLAVNQVTALGSLVGDARVLPGGTIRFTDTTGPSRTFDLTGGGAVSVDAGKTVTFSSSTILGGFLRGAGTHALTGSTLVAGTTVQPGTPVVATSGTLQNVTSGGTMSVNSFSSLTWDGGSLTPAGRLTVNTGAVVNTTAFESSGTIAVNPGGTLGYSGPGPLVLGGGSQTSVGTYNPTTGATTVGGVINLGSQNLVVNGGLVRNNGTISSTGRLVLNHGSIYYAGQGDTDFAGTDLAPTAVYKTGNSPGLSRGTTLTFTGPATVSADMSNATGTVGGFAAPQNNNTPNSGWGAQEYGNSANTAGGLTLQLGAGGRVKWQFVTTLNDGIGSTPGAAANFSAAQPYTWLIFRPRTNASALNPTPSSPADQVNTVATVTLLDQAGNVLPNTDANLNAVLEFDRSQFIDPATNLPIAASAGTFSFRFGPDLIGRPGTTVSLTFTPVPEPGLVLLAGAAGLLALRRVFGS